MFEQWCKIFLTNVNERGNDTRHCGRELRPFIRVHIAIMEATPAELPDALQK
jgi:hypothetical protein